MGHAEEAPSYAAEEARFCTSSRRGEGLETMAKTHLKLVAPATKKRAVAPKRQPNSELRSREHLTETEVEKLIKAAQGNRYGHRDATMSPCCLPPCPARIRDRRPALGADRLEIRNAACPQG